MQGGQGRAGQGRAAEGGGPRAECRGQRADGRAGQARRPNREDAPPTEVGGLGLEYRVWGLACRLVGMVDSPSDIETMTKAHGLQCLVTLCKPIVPIIRYPNLGDGLKLKTSL